MSTREEITEELCQACEDCNEAKVQSILENEECSKFINSKRGTNGPAALHMAAYGGSVSILKLILEKGADISLKDDEGLNIVHWVMKKPDNIEVVEYLIHRKDCTDLIDQPSKNDPNFTPLMCALVHKSADVLKMLLKNGRAVDFEGGNTGENGEYGNTRKKEDEKLFPYSLNLKIVTKEGENIIYLAAKIDDTEPLEIILGKITDSKKEQSLTNDVVSKAIHTTLTAVIKKGDYLTLEKLLTYEEIKFFFENVNNLPYIHLGLEGSRPKEITKVLIKNGSKISQLNDNGDTILHRIAVKGQTDVLMSIVQNIPQHETNKEFTKILNMPCKIYSTKINGQKGEVTLKESTPLHLAAINLRQETLHFLLIFGANPQLKTKAGQTPLKMIQELFQQDKTTQNRKRAEIIQDLKIANSKSEILKRKDKIKSLVEEIQGRITKNLDQVLNETLTKNLFDQLINKFESDNSVWAHPSKIVDEKGRTNVHIGVMKGDIQSTKDWLQKGCSPDALDIYGKTAMYYAVGWPRPEMVKLLRQFDASKDEFFHIIAYHGDMNLFKKYEGECKVQKRYKLGGKYEKLLFEKEYFTNECTLLEVACLQGKCEFVEFLVNIKEATIDQAFVEDYEKKNEIVKREYIHSYTRTLQILKHQKLEQIQVEEPRGNTVTQMQTAVDEMKGTMSHNINVLLRETENITQADNNMKEVCKKVEELKGMVNVDAKKTIKLIHDARQEVLGTMGRHVTEISFHKVFFKVARQIGSQDNKVKWDKLLDLLLKDCLKENAKAILETISEQNNSEWDCAMDILLFWKSINCRGYLSEAAIIKLQNCLDQMGMQDIKVKELMEEERKMWQTQKTVALDKRFLRPIAKGIGKDWKILALKLGFSKTETEHIEMEKRQLYDQAYAMLEKWDQGQGEGCDAVKITLLSNKLTEMKRNDLIDITKSMICIII